MSRPMNHTKKLLIIDDDPDAREMLRQALSEPDFALTFASTGADGLAKAAELIPDLILVDVLMPGMDGFEVCRSLRANPILAEVPIIVVTALGDHTTCLQGLEAGADDYISKPFDVIELQARVRTITHLNRYRRLLVERAKFERMVEPSPNGVLLVDAAGDIHLANPAALVLLGATQQDQVLGQSLRNFVPPEYYDQWAVGLQDVLSHRAHTLHLEATCARLDGSTIPVEVDIGPFVWDGQPMAQLIVRDMTERRRAKAALRQSEQRFRDLFEHSPDAIFVITQDGIVREVNPAACRLYGLPEERLLGQPVADLAPLERRARAAQILSTLRHGETYYFEGCSATGDGRTVPVEIRVSQIDHDGAPALLLHVRDVSELKQLEAQLLQAQKMESVGRLASGVAHDFNNLLTAISGYANLALEQLTSDDPLYGDLREIRNVVERAAGLTRQLLAFARQQVIEPQILNLNDLILDLDKLLRRLIRADIELVTVPAPDLTWIKADPSQIEQLLVNLVVNARDAMPRGGKLLIEAHNIEADHASVQRHLGMAAAGAVCLAVTDTGVGMGETVKSHLFEPFYTTKAPGQGTGLGLATCYGIVKQHGGHIEVDSEVGQGTTFRIYLPRVADVTELRTRRDAPRALPRGTETLLLVEDDPAVRKLAARVLRELGYTVLEAADGAAALRVVETYQEAIALVLTDVIMPQIGGQVLAEQLAALRPGIKVLFISGYADTTVVQHYQLDTNAALLHKPFTPIALACKVREVLGEELPYASLDRLAERAAQDLHTLAESLHRAITAR